MPREALAQSLDLAEPTARGIEPLVDLVPCTVLGCAPVPHDDVLVEVLEPGVDDHRVDRLDVELGTQRPGRVSDRSADRRRLLVIGYWKLGMTDTEYGSAHDHDRDADHHAVAREEAGARHAGVRP